MKNIGRFNIISKIGENERGTVYRVLDPDSNREVALKLLKSQYLYTMTAERKFHTLAKEIQTLRHPAINQILEYGDEDNRPFLVMPLLTGGNLSERLKKDGLPIDEVISILLPVAEALDFAAKGNVLHQDLKPNNIVFDEQGKPYLVDLGIVQIVDELSTASAPKANPYYVSPEQVRDRDLTGLIHVYSLGAIAYELLSGRPVFSGASPMVTAFKHVSGNPKPASLHNPALTPAIDDVLLQALEKRAEERQLTATRFIRQLEAARGGPLEPRYAEEPIGAERAETLYEAPLHENQIESRQTRHIPAATAPVRSGPRSASLTMFALVGMFACILLVGISCGAYFLIAPGGTPELTAIYESEATAAAENTLTVATNRLQEAYGWPIQLSESFDDNRNLWLEGQFDDAFAANDFALDGQLRWTITAHQSVLWRVWPEDSNSVGDFYVSVEAQRVTGIDTAGYGITFRNSLLTEGYYVFDVRDTGVWNVSLWDGQSWSQLIADQFSDHIRPSESNRLEMIGEGADFYFYINGNYVGALNDSRLESGIVGLSMTLNQNGDQATVLFDNYVISVREQ
jgi:hypothetical protein